MFIGVLVFIIFTLIAGGVSLLFLTKKTPRKKREKEDTSHLDEVRQETSGVTGVTHHVDELVPVQFHNDGIYEVDGIYCGIGKIDGTNFSVMSEQDQNTRESVIIDILARLDNPVQFVTTTIVANTGQAAKDIARMADQMPDNALKTYAALYAKALDDMQKERRILTQCSWFILTDDGTKGDPVKKLIETMNILERGFKQRAGIIFTPLRTTEEVLDVFGQIIDSDNLTRPSEYLQNLKAIHISEREVRDYENIRLKKEAGFVY